MDSQFFFWSWIFKNFFSLAFIVLVCFRSRAITAQCSALHNNFNTSFLSIILFHGSSLIFHHFKVSFLCVYVVMVVGGAVKL